MMKQKQYYFVLALLLMSGTVCRAQSEFPDTDKDKEIIIDNKKPDKFRMGLTMFYNHTLHDYENLPIANEYCEECFANGWGDGYSIGLVFEYLLGEKYGVNPSVMVKLNYESLPANLSDDNFLQKGYAFINDQPVKRIATFDYSADYDLKFLSLDVLYKINLPGTNIYAFLGPSINYTLRHKLHDRITITTPGLVFSPPGFWTDNYTFLDSMRTVVYDDDILKGGNYTRIALKIGLTFPITIKRFTINPFMQLYYSFRDYNSKIESLIYSWSGGIDLMYSI